MPVVAKALGDKSSSVRAAAVATLRAQGSKEAVSALVAGLKKNQSGRLQAEILQALRALTRAFPCDAYKGWRRWWRLVEGDFELPKTGSLAASIRKRGATATRGLPTYYGSEVVSRRLTFIVDISGSMSAQVASKDGPSASRLERCKRELQGVISALPKKAFFNVVWFNHTFVSWMPSLSPASGCNKKAAGHAVSSLKPAGGTNIFDPLEAALRDPQVDTIYLLSDGAPSSGRIVDPESILREVRKLNAVRRVAIHTISIGAASTFMKQLAGQNSGQAISR